MLLEDQKTDKDYMEWVMAWRKRVCEDIWSVEMVSLTKNLSRATNDYAGNVPAHVRIAKVLEERGEDIGAGVRISYVVTDGNTSPATVIPASDYVGDLDRWTLWNKQVYPATLRLLAGAFPTLNWKAPLLNKPKRIAPEEQLGLF